QRLVDRGAGHDADRDRPGGDPPGAHARPPGRRRRSPAGGRRPAARAGARGGRGMSRTPRAGVLDLSDALGSDAVVSTPPRWGGGPGPPGRAALVAPGGAPGPTARAAGAAPAEAPRARKVLVISLPGLTWAEVRDHDLPHIRALLARSGVADMAPRGVSAQATAGAAYLTISGGWRATSDPLSDAPQPAGDDHMPGSPAAT